MKFLSATLLIASLTASASAFSAVAPKSAAAKMASIDKTLQSVDADPTALPVAITNALLLLCSELGLVVIASPLLCVA
jgi:hypothetical protein